MNGVTQTIKWVFCLVLVFSLVFAASRQSPAEEEKPKSKSVNINSASVEEFMQVPMITRELAENIIEYREEAGYFQILDELLQVEGFTRELLDKLRPYLRLEGLGIEDCTC